MSSKIKTLSMFGLAAGLLATAVTLSLPTTPEAAKEPEPKKIAAPAEQPLVQIALLLDTSSSMDGLIDQAKSQLWKIVNRFGDARRDDQAPRLQIALYEYGNDGLSADGGWIRQVEPFTADLDRLSESLFRLRTNGGTELAGQVIKTAATELAWADDPKALKMIFIAGNEEFDQGSISPREAIAFASRKGIAVNTIFCGGSGDATAQAWKDGAVLADGSFMTIDQNSEVVHVAAPQDQEIAHLGQLMNETYVPYGEHGAAGSSMQVAQDGNAHKMKQGAFLQRSIAKASGYYDNARWDLVDAVDKDAKALEGLDEGALPAPMRNLKPEERKAYVETQAKKRKEIQAQIKTLSAERAEFVKKEEAKQGDGTSTLDVAMTKMVEKEASKKGLRLK